MYGGNSSAEVLTDAALEAFIAALQVSTAPGVPPKTPAERIDRIAALERLTSACAAAQAAETAALVASRMAALAVTTQERVAKVRRGVAAEVALARRVSPSRGSKLTGLATVLHQEMPRLLDAFRAGRIGERQALFVVAETSTLSLEHRRRVDSELSERFGSMSDKDAAAAAARIGYRLDAEQAIKRVRRAENDRRVTIRPAPDTMVYLTALLPVVQGVAAFAALTKQAASATASGDTRGRGQLMADQLVTSVTNPMAVGVRASNAGEAAPIRDAAAVAPTGDVDGAILTTGCATVPAGTTLDIQLVMTDRTLFDGDPEPAILTGYGPIPAALARHLVRTCDQRTKTWVRRLYADPKTGMLIGGDSRRRFFPDAARDFLVARDQICRTPWCDAPIRDADHAIPYAKGGRTELANGNGRCRSCNLAKEEGGWRSRADPGGGTIVITTPTGHEYRSDPPPAPRSAPWNETRADARARPEYVRAAV